MNPMRKSELESRNINVWLKDSLFSNQDMFNIGTEGNDLEKYWKKIGDTSYVLTQNCLKKGT